jgi:hypothetical protein
MDSIDSEPVRQHIADRVAAYLDATEPGAQLVARTELAETIVSHGRPSWDLHSMKGPIPATADGCYFIPTALLLAIAEAWLDTLDEKPTRRRRAP